jgi:hypothetical protein
MAITPIFFIIADIGIYRKYFTLSIIETKKPITHKYANKQAKILLKYTSMLSDYAK